MFITSGPGLINMSDQPGNIIRDSKCQKGLKHAFTVI